MNLDEMYTWWNESAKQDPMRAILSDRATWGKEEFFATGKQWLRDHFAWASASGFKPGGGRALDYGCGLGRITNALAEHYTSAVGIDISDEMIRLAQSHARMPNVQFLQVIGVPIPEPDQSFDLIYSTIVIQHIDAPSNLEAVSDLFRLCAKGGYLLFDAPSHTLGGTAPPPSAGIFFTPLESVLLSARKNGLDLLALRNFPATETRHYQYLFHRLE
jgi:2-polyprenyl-3-methyl-5-hydroxy-6-metoxy-1,4-benzoquinol methylase